ncbi:MAG: ATP-binding protein [Eggerthellaceae bacterium]|nr:ATP-binding protein [Eggerthellaceae bacterium]
MENRDLKDFIETASSVSPFRVENDFGGGYVRLRSEEAERRQAIHDIRSSEDVVIEALRNSRDAHAHSIFLAVSKEGDERKILLIDDGDGVPPYMHKHIFEPRVTSKLDSAHLDKWGVHGRGMALYSISVNCKQARIAASDQGLGAAFEFVVSTSSLGEKADQSTFPTFELTDTGKVQVRGPKNILRTACEFAVDSADTCTVYFGSPGEIAATLYIFSLATLPAVVRAFGDDPESLPVCKRLGLASDPASFRFLASNLGFSLSERTCRRVLDGQIAPVEPLTARIEIKGMPSSDRKPRRQKKSRLKALDARGLSIETNDLASFKSAVKQAYGDLARDYYLIADVEPEVVVRKDRIVVSIPVEKI